MSVEVRRRRFTVHDYHAMADAGILHPDDRVELIDGEIIEMAAMGSPHAESVDRLTELLVPQVLGKARVRVQSSVRLSDLSEPQPDVSLLRSRDGGYGDGHPGPPDTLLIIEVSHTTLGYDRGVKLPLYATTRIPEVWIVDVDAEAVEVYRDPAPGEYREKRIARRGDVLHPALLPEVAVPVEAILP